MAVRTTGSNSSRLRSTLDADSEGRDRKRKQGDGDLSIQNANPAKGWSLLYGFPGRFRQATVPSAGEHSGAVKPGTRTRMKGRIEEDQTKILSSDPLHPRSYPRHPRSLFEGLVFTAFRSSGRSCLLLQSRFVFRQ
jgi:hypothetical protein